MVARCNLRGRRSDTTAFGMRRAADYAGRETVKADTNRTSAIDATGPSWARLDPRSQVRRYRDGRSEIKTSVSRTAYAYLLAQCVQRQNRTAPVAYSRTSSIDTHLPPIR